MKRILNIVRYDLKKITGSVVAIVTIMGLCLVPCCYAWFNILSNWAPYESDATGRIAVAVANMDKGSSVAGLTINVGDKIVEGLEANEDIGWVFTENDTEAIDGVRSGDYYAALVVPEGFTADVLSFTDGDLTNPKLLYYENEKKNAIAPKITGKAKTAVQEQVNATFVETLAKYVTDAASVAEANGIDPAEMLGDLSVDIDRLSRDMTSCIALADSASGLTSAAGNIVDVSGALIDDTQDVLTANDSVLKEIEKNIPKGTKSSSDALKKVTDFTDKVKSRLHPIDTGIKPLKDAETAVFNLYVDKTRDKDKKTVDELKADAEKQAKTVSDAGFTVLASDLTALADKLGEVSDDLAALNKDMTEEEREAALAELIADLDDAAKLDEQVNKRIKTDIEDNLAAALSNTKNAVASLRKSLSSANSDLSGLSSTLGSYTGALNGLKKSVNSTAADLRSLQDSSAALSDLLSNAAGSDLL
ncbi:MAG: YhgE/Pip family protein, partial [Mogibacterium sp.]|nr:YhgE/Pip family protein [Mogibacterium sp.]